MSTNPSDNNSEEKDLQEKEPGLRQIVSSILSAAIGVQSSKNHERDFKHGKARIFIITGIIFTVLFIATVFSVVNIVLKQAGH